MLRRNKQKIIQGIKTSLALLQCLVLVFSLIPPSVYSQQIGAELVQEEKGNTEDLIPESSDLLETNREENTTEAASETTQPASISDSVAQASEEQITEQPEDQMESQDNQEQQIDSPAESLEEKQVEDQPGLSDMGESGEIEEIGKVIGEIQQSDEQQEQEEQRPEDSPLVKQQQEEPQEQPPSEKPGEAQQPTSYIFNLTDNVSALFDSQSLGYTLIYQNKQLGFVFEEPVLSTSFPAGEEEQETKESVPADEPMPVENEVQGKGNTGTQAEETEQEATQESTTQEPPITQELITEESTTEERVIEEPQSGEENQQQEQEDEIVETMDEQIDEQNSVSPANKTRQLPIIENSTVRYEFGNVVFIYTISDQGVKEEIILSSEPEFNTFQFRLLQQGLSVFEEQDGFYFSDSETSQVIFIIPKNSLVVKDSNGSSSTAVLSIDQSQGIAVLSIDRNFLKTAIYPVVIDPTVVVSSSSVTTATQPSTMRNVVKTSEGTLHTFVQMGTDTSKCGSGGLWWLNSLDSGSTWTCQGQLSSDTTNLMYADARVDSSDNIYVVYSYAISGGSTSSDVFYRKLTKGVGSIWTMEAQQTVLDSTLSTTGYHYAVLELQGTTKIWLAVRYYNGTNYQVTVYYSDGLGTVPTWTQSVAALDTPGSSSSYRYPTIVRFGSSIGVIYHDQTSTYLKWRWRADTDGLTSWVAESTAMSQGWSNPTFSAVGDGLGNVYLALNYSSNIYFTYYNGIAWSSYATVSSAAASSAFVSVVTDGTTNAWVFYGETTGLSSGLSGSRKLVYKKGVPPFSSSDFEVSSTPVVSYHTTFDKYWSYVSSVYTDDTTDASNTTSADTQMVTGVGDIAYFGKTEKFDAISWDISTNGSGGVVAWEYCSAVDATPTCTIWSPLSFSVSSYSNFTSDGWGAFTAPSDWQAAKVNNETTAYYYIRARVTTAYTTSPIGVQMAAIPQINWAGVTPTVVSNTTHIVWTENAASPTRIRYSSVTTTASPTPSSTANISPAVVSYSSQTTATQPSTMRHLVRTSDGTLHAFVQAGTIQANGCSYSQGLLWLNSTDSGSTWTCQGQLSSDTTNLMYADARIDSSDNIYVVYSVAATGGNTAYDVFYRKLTKGIGSTWTLEAAQTVIDSTLSSTGYSYATLELQGTTRLWLATRAYNQAMSINAIGWNGSYFLIGGEAGKLAKYDGTTWTDLTSAANFGNYQIGAISWNSTNNYWLIGGGDLDSNAGLKLLKYDGTTFTDLTSSMAGWTGYPIQTISYNSTNNYFLIGGGDKDDADVSRLNKYDGTTFTDLSASLVNFANHPVNSISYNSTNNYFLIGGGDSDACTASTRLNKYDGTSFTDLSASLSNFVNCPVLAIAYNSTNNYFLIGGGDADESGYDVLNKYDGTTFTDLDTPLTFNYAVQTISYNSSGNYFILGSGDDDVTYSDTRELRKYDGTSFTTLSPSSGFSRAAMASACGGTNCLLGGGLLITGGNGNGLNNYDGTIITDLKLSSFIEIFGEYYTVSVYYSSDLTAAPSWTISQKYLDTPGNSNNYHYPTIVRFGSKIGIIYNDQTSTYLKWRWRADTDGLTSWVAESTAMSQGWSSPTFSAVGDGLGNVYLALNYSSNIYFTYYNGIAWSSYATVSSAAASSAFVSVVTDGTNAWVFYGETTGLSSGLSGSRKLVYKKGVPSFSSSDFDASSTAVVSYHTTFDKYWSYVSSVYTDDTTDASNTTSADTQMVTGVGDIAYFGKTTKFDAISWDVSTNGVGGLVLWEYWNGTSWMQMAKFLAASNSTFGGDGYLSFIPHTDWATTTVNAEATPYYYIRARVTTAYTTSPIGVQMAAIPQINWAGVTPTVVSNTTHIVWTENAASPTRIRYSSVTTTASPTPSSTANISPAVVSYSSQTTATQPSTMRHLVRTSEGTLHAFVQAGTIQVNGCSYSQGLLWLNSTDSGSTWICQGQLSSDTTNLMYADARVDASDNIYVVYSMATDGGGTAKDVFYRKLTKGVGSTWTLEAAQTAIDSTLSTTGYSYATLEIQGTTRLWLATRAYNQAMSINAISWNGSYFLVGGEGGKLAKYDGTTWTDLTSAANFGNYQIGAISWNSTNNYWLIGGGDLDGNTGLKLLKYDGTTFTDLTSSMAGWTGYPIQTISYNSTNNYFLIGGGDKDDADVSRLNKYDGTTFTDLSASLVGFANHPVNSISYNSTNNYFLIGGGDSDACTASTRLNKYDGATFTNLSASLSGFVNCPILAISWNSTNNYFLIGGGDADTSNYDVLNRYDGTTFTDLDTPLTFSYAVQTISYNSSGNYFILGSGYDDVTYSDTRELRKYDGTSFITLSPTSGFNRAAMASACGGTNCLIGGGLLITGGNGNGFNNYDGTIITDLKSSSFINIFGEYYTVSVYYSSDLTAAPSWTISQKYLDTLGNSSSYHYPTIVRFGSKIGVIYSDQPSGGYLKWRWRNDSDGLTSWIAESTTGSNIYNAATFSAVGDTNGKVYLAANYSLMGYIYFNYFNGIAWSSYVTVSSTAASSASVSVVTDGTTNAWVFYGERTGLSSDLSGRGKLVYKKGIPPFSSSDFDPIATPVVSYHTTFDKYWSYVSSVYIDDTTDAGNTTSADTQMVTGVGDIVYFGKTTKFDAISWDVSTNGVGGQVLWEYWNGTSWMQIAKFLAASNSTFGGDGYLSFIPHTDWATTTVNAEATPYYYIRARVITAYTTSPIGVQMAAIPQINWAGVTPTVVSNTTHIVWTENAASATRVRYASVTTTASTAPSPSSTANISPAVTGYSSVTTATQPSTMRHIVRTSEGTLHAFVQAGTIQVNGCSYSQGLLWLNSTDSGATWICQGQLSSDTTNLMYADARVDASDNIYVVYSVAVSGANASYDVFYRKLTKGVGSTWTLEAAQTAIDSTLSTTGYSYATLELQETTKLWLATRAYNQAMSINVISWNGSYFLVGGEGGKLAKYDGTIWTDLTSSANFGSYQIGAISWNSTNNYWLIGGGDLDGNTGLKLLKYDGTTFTDLTSSMAGWTGYPIQTISYNSTNNYFLIGGGDKDDADVSRLNKYDGTTFTDLSASLVGFANHPVNSISYNSTNNYFLIGGGDSDACTASTRLNKYDGATFTNLSASLSGFVNCPILAISYNSTNNYFLIGGGDSDTSGYDVLNKYDGTTFTDLDTPLTFNYAVQTISYNSSGNYFILGSGWDDFTSATAELRKYDGSSFTTLSPTSLNYSAMASACGGANCLIGGGLLITGGNGNGLNNYDGTIITDLKSSSFYGIFGEYYTVSIYYSSDLTAAPSWTTSQKYLDTPGNSSSYHYPTIVRFGTKIGVIYNDQTSGYLKWRWRADTDGLTSWVAESTAMSQGWSNPTFSAVGDGSGNVYLALNYSTAIYFTYYNGIAWSSYVTVSSTAASAFVSVATDGALNAWVFYGETTGLSSGLSGSRKLVYKKGVPPFSSSDFDSTATGVNSNHSTFDKYWSYVSSVYTDDTTDAGNTVSADTQMVTGVGDIAYFGKTEKYDAISWDVSTNGSSEGRIAWEYWNGSAWMQLVDFLGVSNTTFAGDGYISFIPPSDWATTSINAEATSYYYIRARVITAYSTSPVGVQMAAIPQINWASVANSAVAGLFFIWTENAASPTRVRFSSVVFNTAPNAPSSLGPSNYVDGSWGNDNTPTLQFTQSDPDTGDTVKYRIQIDDSSDFGSLVVDYTSGLLSQGSTSFTVGQAAGSGSYTVGSVGQTLSDNSYYWRVMSTDNNNATSSWATANSGNIAFKIDTTPPTSVSVTSITENPDSAYQYVSGANTVYYNTATSSGSFIVNATGTDLESGIQKINLPALTNFAPTNGGDDTSSPYSWTYNWTLASTQNGLANIAAYNNAGSTTTAPFYVYLDTTAPSGGSITYTDGYYTATSVQITYATGTDSGSGLSLSTGKIQRKEADLSAGSCGSYGSWSDLATESDGSYTDSSVVSGKCYQYQYLISDNVSNQATYTSANTAKIDTSTPDIVMVDAGSLSTDRTSLTSDTWFKYSDTGSDDQISFSWTDPSSLSDDIFYYELNTDSGNTITGDESTTTNPYIDGITITEGISYFHARPKNSAGTWGTERIFIIKYDKTPPTNIGISSITADSSSQLTVNALTASDSGSGLHSQPYYFDRNSGEANSDWQTSNIWSDSGLSPNTQYTYKVKVRDAVNNESSYSATSLKYTLANQPSNPSVTADSQTQITFSWSSNSNPSGTEYFAENTTAGTNSSWITTASWSSSNLNCGTNYSFRVKAKNGDDMETAFTSEVSVSTQVCHGGGMPSAWYNPPSAPAPSTENPQGSFRILINNGNEYTNSLIVTLNLFAGSDTKRMAISNFPDFHDAGQEKYQTTKEWNLCKGLSENPVCKCLLGLQVSSCELQDLSYKFQVYAKFYTEWGIVSGVVSDSIVYKKEIPEEKLIAKLPPPEVKPPTPKESKLPTGQAEKPEKPFIEKVPEILKPLVPEFLRPKPPEIKPPEVPIEELVPKEAPLAFQGKWQLLPSKPIREFVLAPLPKEMRKLAQKFPELEKTFEEVGITKITDVAKLKVVKLTLPGLTERVGLPTARVEPGKFALPAGVPVAQLSPEIKKAIPTEIVFAKTGGQMIDFNIALTVTEKGEPEQRISTISGKPLQLVVKPDKPVKSVKGYVVWKQKNPKSQTLNPKFTPTPKFGVGARIPITPEGCFDKLSIYGAGKIQNSKPEISFNSLLASVFFALPSFAKSYNPVEIETRLVLLEFEYTDPDGDGIYTAEIQAPIVEGEYEIVTVMDYEDPELGKKEIRLITVVDPEGYIYTQLAEGKLRIAGAIVSLYWLNPEIKQYQLWPAKEYQQENPQTTDDTGKYSFLVPPGTYYLRVEHPNYPVEQSKTFIVKEGSGIHMNIELKTKFWWLKIVDWKIAIIILFGIFLAYNFYRDRIREKLLKKPKTYE